MQAQVFMIPTEYNMRYSITKTLSKAKKQLQSYKQRAVKFEALFITSLLINIALVVVAFDFATKYLKGLE